MGLTPNDIVFLQACHQNTGSLDGYILSIAGKCSENITPSLLVKTKAGSIRLSRNGKDLIKRLHEATEDPKDVLISEYLLSVFKDDGDKLLCSKKKLTTLVVWLRNLLGMTPKQFLKLIQTYLADEEAFKFNRKVDYLIYKPYSSYMGTLSLKNGESRLYEYYMDNKEELDKTLTDT